MNADDPAFPSTNEQYENRDGVTCFAGPLGLTKREWFIGMAMQGILAGAASKTNIARWTEGDMKAVMQRAKTAADAALEDS